MWERCAGVPRRLWLLGFAVLLAGPAEGAEGTRRQRRAPPSRAETPLPLPPPPPPRIEGPPAPSRIPGSEPAPVPRRDISPPSENRQPGPQLDLGVPTAPLIPEGQTFRQGDPSPDQRQPSGIRLPSPGATLRLPF